MTLAEILKNIEPSSGEAYIQAKKRWDSIAKPLGSLGLLETTICKIASVLGTPEIGTLKKAVAVMCADNGVVEEGVSQTGQEVTAAVAENMARGYSSVCAMARYVRADVFPVDIGVYRKPQGFDVVDACVRRGTRNMTREPAMTSHEAAWAVMNGVEFAGVLKSKGYGLIATGEMGIGNTTTSSAVASVFLELPPEKVTGRGAGLSDAGLERKISAIKRAVELNKPDKDDPLDVIGKVGGLDIAGLCGVFLGGAFFKIPVIIDGFISSVSALAAVKMCPHVIDYMLPSHVSGEPACALVLEKLGLKAPVHAEMSLGEGTGAVTLMPMIEMALAVYNEMPTFSQVGIEAYTPQS